EGVGARLRSGRADGVHDGQWLRAREAAGRRRRPRRALRDDADDLLRRARRAQRRLAAAGGGPTRVGRAAVVAQRAWGSFAEPRVSAGAEGGGTTGPMSPSGASSRSTITGA